MSWLNEDIRSDVVPAARSETKNPRFRRLTRDLGHAIPRCVQLDQQSFGVTTPDWIQARIMLPRKLDREKPAVLAQSQSCTNGLFAGN
jgi:hypothetical protein